MAFKLKSLAVVGALLGTLALAGCGQEEKDPNHIKVGVIVGAEQQVAEAAAKVAKDKYGLDVELVTFNDYVLPNEALSKGDIDLNAFQHKPYLDQQIKDRGYKLVSVGNTFVYPIAGYSRKIKNLDDLQPGSQVAVPNDPTNLGRSLLLLQKVGLIKLKDDIGLLPTVLDAALGLPSQRWLDVDTDFGSDNLMAEGAAPAQQDKRKGKGASGNRAVASPR
ncbi:MetQ/NlpA family lipoprotein [Stenotrophomonas indicatrix]|uniref:MetQ/NlpA family lipoprotein n=1 Tax=Stenotrophomonas indicatrix TaxID=2045451 RepID=UPI0028973697|nr:MetQ/NlpA family lipoprotein [Stenotrophomonas indicatrix]